MCKSCKCIDEHKENEETKFWQDSQVFPLILVVGFLSILITTIVIFGLTSPDWDTSVAKIIHHNSYIAENTARWLMVIGATMGIGFTLLTTFVIKWEKKEWDKLMKKNEKTAN